MTGSTPHGRRPFGRRSVDAEPSVRSQGALDEGRGPGASPEAEAAPRGSGEPGSTEAAHLDRLAPAPFVRGRIGTVGQSVRRGKSLAMAHIAHLTDRIIEVAPRVPVRDLAALRRRFPDLGPEEMADKLVAGASYGTSTVGAGVGAAAMLPVPPAMPTELAAEVVGVAAIELKLIAELHEVYGQRPPGDLKDRSRAYLASWTQERGVEVTRPATFNAALGGPMKRRLRQQIMKRMVRNLPSLTPFLVGAAVGAVMNRRDTRRIAEHVRADLRRRQVAWDDLPALPSLEKPPNSLPPSRFPGEPQS